MLHHLLRAGGAVQTDGVDAHRLQDGRGGGNIGADQHRPRGLDSDLDNHRHIDTRSPASVLRTIHRRLDLQRILAGLDQDAVDPAGDQPVSLQAIGRLQIVIGDVAQARQLGAGTDGAEHVAANAIRLPCLVHHLPRQPGSALVQVECLIRQVELAQRDGRRTEGIGLDDVGTGFNVAAMNLSHDVGTGPVQDLGTVLLSAVINLDVQSHGLHTAAHGAVTEQDVALQSLDQITHARADAPVPESAIRSPVCATSIRRQTSATMSDWFRV